MGIFAQKMCSIFSSKSEVLTLSARLDAYFQQQFFKGINSQSVECLLMLIIQLSACAQESDNNG